MTIALCEACKGLEPGMVGPMRLDEAIALLMARVRLMERAERDAKQESRAPVSRSRGDGKREVHFKGGYDQLVAAARSLKGQKK